MEVPMLKSKRHLPHFDSLEHKLLLSAGIADIATTQRHDPAKRFVLTGSISGLPSGIPGVAGYTETSFPISGHSGSMGIITGSFKLANPFIPIGKLPNLAGASLTLANTKGTIALSISQAKAHEYKFSIISGTDKFAKASGSGTMTISSVRSSLDLIVKLKSTLAEKT
jgi:hypothetical protein